MIVLKFSQILRKSPKKMQNLYQKLLNAPKNSPVFLSEKLECEFLLNAYKFGLFPWTSAPVSWWCPDPRMILRPREIYRQKSLKRFLNRYEIALDADFDGLIKMCATLREKTWLDSEFIDIYSKLYAANIAHCVAVYDGGVLVGGIYGLIIGKMFFGESMVSLAKNASKVALTRLCDILAPHDFLIDCQVYNPHLSFMGAKMMPRAEFLGILEEKVMQKSGFKNFATLLEKR